MADRASRFAPRLIFAWLFTSACGCVVQPRPELLASAPPAFPDAEWDAMLKRYVDDVGRVDYAAVDRPRLEGLYAAVAATGPGKDPDKYPTAAAREAYYLNVYNVLVWKGVLDRLPGLRSVGQQRTRFFYLTREIDSPTLSELPSRPAVSTLTRAVDPV